MRQQNQTQHQTQAQQQTQQTQQQTLQGGIAMKEELQNQQIQSSFYFVTFVYKVDPETSKQILAELRRRFPSLRPIFIPSPPPGKKKFVNINGILTILTFPHTKQEQIYNQNSTGFTLKELAKIKKT